MSTCVSISPMCGFPDNFECFLLVMSLFKIILPAMPRLDLQVTRLRSILPCDLGRGMFGSNVLTLCVYNVVLISSISSMSLISSDIANLTLGIWLRDCQRWKRPGKNITSETAISTLDPVCFRNCRRRSACSSPDSVAQTHVVASLTPPCRRKGYQLPVIVSTQRQC
jgi:hypothetical protein